jgi:hypothetical protein
MLFGLGYDGVAGTDPHVIAGIKLAQDILDVYALEQPTYNMVYHTGAVEDGSCMIGVGACDWHFSDGEGGFHYSAFALTKGLGEYIAPSLTDPANWYAKVIDLHLTQQQANGSWPQDGRDDGSALLATEFPVATIGLVGVAPPSHGRMTGGGSVFTSSGVRVTHGFELHCTPSDGANSLEVNWDAGNTFHLTSLASATCTDNATIEPNPPAAAFDTYRGSGTGLYNGQAGATADWTFTDAGEPGKNDTATIVIRDASNTIVLTVSGKLDNGNQQAHKN